MCPLSDGKAAVSILNVKLNSNSRTNQNIRDVESESSGMLYNTTEASRSNNNNLQHVCY